MSHKGNNTNELLSFRFLLQISVYVIGVYVVNEHEFLRICNMKGKECIVVVLLLNKLKSVVCTYTFIALKRSGTFICKTEDLWLHAKRCGVEKLPENITSTEKCGGGSIMLFGWFSSGQG